MPTPTFTPLATTTLTSSAVDVTFSNIPQTYKDLVLSVHAKTATPGVTLKIYINGDSGTNYAFVRVTARGPNGITNSAYASDTAIYLIGQEYGTDPIYVQADFINYSSTDRGKIVLTRTISDDDPLGDQRLQINSWRWKNNSNGITSLRIVEDYSPASWAAGSTFSLWGIEA